MDVVKEGFVKTKGKRYGIWWRRWLVLHRATSVGATRLSIYSSCKVAKEKPKATLYIQDVHSVLRLSSKVKKSAIAIVTRDDYSWELSFETDGDTEDWINVVLLEHQKRGVAKFFTSSSIYHQISSYLNTDQYDIFPVCPMAYTELGDFHGECLMAVTPETIQIIDVQPTCILATWRIKHLRKFGLKAGRIILEAGRNCDSGVGLFVFSSIYSADIYERLRHHAHVLAGGLVLHSRSHSDSTLSLDSTRSNENLAISWSGNESASSSCWSLHNRPLPRLPDSD